MLQGAGAAPTNARKSVKAREEPGMKALPCTPLRVAVHVALLIAGSLGTAHLAVAQEPTPDQQNAIRSNCRIAFTNLPKRLGRVGPLTSRKPADHWRDE